MRAKRKNRRKLRETVLDLLHEMLGSETAALHWLDSPNPDFGGLTPADLIHKGKIEAILDYLQNIRTGQLS